MASRRLLAVLAHPDDESLGIGSTLAKYAAEGVEVHLLTATRGERGRYGHLRAGEDGHPGAAVLGQIRSEELHAAADTLGIRSVSFLGYEDAHLDRADPAQAIRDITAQLRRIRPDVVVTFGPDGAYGHPDHIAISQLTTAAVMAASVPTFDAGVGDAPHAVSKLYYIAWPRDTWAAYQAAFKRLAVTVDGIERRAVPWPDWAISTVVDTRHLADTTWQAVRCHRSQMSSYGSLVELSEADRLAIWGRQCFYRAFSTVNGGRMHESDLFEGVT